MNLAADDFAVLGLPQRFALDGSQVDASWRALLTSVHPDRLAAAGAAEQQAAMQWALRINEARERLRSPVERARVLCALRGVPLDAPGAAPVPPAVLLRQMAWREALEAAGDEAGVHRLDAEVSACEAQLLEELRLQLDERGDAVAAAQTARGLMFVVKLRAEIDARLEALEG